MIKECPSIYGTIEPSRRVFASRRSIPNEWRQQARNTRMRRPARGAVYAVRHSTVSTRHKARFRKHFRLRSAKLGSLRAPQLTEPGARARQSCAVGPRQIENAHRATRSAAIYFIISSCSVVVVTVFRFITATELYRFYPIEILL